MVGVLGVVGVVLLAPAGVAAVEPAERGVWRLDETGTPGRATDSSSFGNHGTGYNVTGNGSGYLFNGASSRVVVPDADSLDPGTAGFSFGVTIVMTTPPARGETYDVLRKGISSTKGGEFKIEITNVNGTARARCLVKDANKVVVAIVAPTSLANGLPHMVTCTKTSRAVSVRIDALTPVTKTVAALGSVSNANAIGIGAKAENTARSGFDWYRGMINDAWVRVG